MWISAQICGILFDEIIFNYKCLNYNGFMQCSTVLMLNEAQMFTTMKSRFVRPKSVAMVAFLLFFQVALAQKAAIIKFDALQKILDTKAEQIQVINFWATWCAPCVKELPLLEKLNTQNNLNAKITLISLDFADKIDKVNEFITRKNIQSDVLLLDEVDYNSWIDKVDKTWSGAIPATLIFNPMTGQRKFLEKELKDGELEKLVAELK